MHVGGRRWAQSVPPAASQLGQQFHHRQQPASLPPPPSSAPPARLLRGRTRLPLALLPVSRPRQYAFAIEIESLEFEESCSTASVPNPQTCGSASIDEKSF